MTATNEETKQYRNPSPTVDVLVLVGSKESPEYVLVRRSKAPLGLAFPGGFVDYGESCEQAAVRELKEETGLDITLVEQFHTYSNPDRDPRKHIMTTVFIATAFGQTPKAGDDAADTVTVPMFEEPKEPLAFDHFQILHDLFDYIDAGVHPSVLVKDLV